MQPFQYRTYISQLMTLLSFTHLKLFLKVLETPPDRFLNGDFTQNHTRKIYFLHLSETAKKRISGFFSERFYDNYCFNNTTSFEINNSTDLLQYINNVSVVYFVCLLDHQSVKIMFTYIQTKSVWTNIKSSQWYGRSIIGNKIRTQLKQKMNFMKYFLCIKRKYIY